MESTDTPRPALPDKTTPTWEIELLISGAVVFALVQLLDPLDLWFAKWSRLAPSELFPLVMYAFLYGKVVLFVLIATFVLHIGARAAWVALVGTSSVFPHGPKWHNLSGGPIARRVAQQCAGDVDAAIERADNRAGLVFGYGMLLAMFAVLIALFTAVAVGVARLLEYSTGIAPFRSLIAGLAVTLLPMLVPALADRLFGARLRPDGRAARWIAAGLRFGQWMTLGRLTTPLMPILITNVGGRRGVWLLLGLLYLAIAVAFADVMSLRGVWQPLRDVREPDSAHTRGAYPLHYATARDAYDRHAAVPFIEHEIADGPYLRLFIPYRDEQHGVAMRTHCATQVSALAALASAEPAEESAALEAQHHRVREAESAFMACLGDLLQLRLDGQPIDGLVLERQRDPFSGHDGALAMIDIRALAPGRHELMVGRLPSEPRGFGNEPHPPQPPDRIVFWR